MKKEECRKQKTGQRRKNAPFAISAFYILPSALTSALILLVRFYQLILSPAKTFLFGPAAECRFEPSCSDYALDALKSHGAVAGGWLAVKRVCRCHPWGGCGHDPVPAAKASVGDSKTEVRPLLKPTRPAEFRS
ncbi:MAG TPA: membrane protein insertion efficiency factor YidD [Verrucomicrobiae bacterium]|nr:membrane protein insertion efficiency factor YidD [Verrucomicrobiae bacterium]